MISFSNQRLLFQALLLLVTAVSFAQTPVEGYVFENNNGGFIDQVQVSVYQLKNKKLLDTVRTDVYGHFSLRLEPGQYLIASRKDIFEERLDTVTVQNAKLFLKAEMHRKQGYLLEAKLVETGSSPEDAKKGLPGVTVEVYNRTNDQVETVLKLKTTVTFQQHFKQGNHYTILIRKPGFIGRRIEVDVNTNGCAFCVDGIPDYTKEEEPKIIAGNKVIPITANIALERSIPGKHLSIPLTFSNYDHSNAQQEQPEAAAQLNKVALLMKDNPDLSFEIDQHTDARGKDEYNLELSQKRAEWIRNYLIGRGIDPARLTAKGYGETQLLNTCTNGVECTEAEHARNRRTELVITDILPEYNWLAIEQIVEEEKIEERSRAEQSQKVEMEKPVIVKPRPKKTPEANNSVPLPEFQGDKKTKN